RRLEGVGIHSADELERVIEATMPEVVILAMPDMVRSKRAVVVDRLQHTGVNVLSLPGLSEFLNAEVSLCVVRALYVTDLLSRDPVLPDAVLLGSAIKDKVVLVTGAGGSIGSELVRKILPLRPSSVILLEMTESALYAIEMEAREILRECGVEATIVPE